VFMGPAGEVVDDLGPDGVIYRQPGMVEEPMLCHPEATHDGLGRLVREGRHGPQLRQPYRTERHVHGSPGGFGRVAVMPGGRGESPSDFHAPAARYALGIGLSPVNPMNSPVSTTSRAQSPNPCSSKRASIQSTKASLASRSRDGK
jgi:hypothetical protein